MHAQTLTSLLLADEPADVCRVWVFASKLPELLLLEGRRAEEQCAREVLETTLIKHWLSWPTCTHDSLLAENALLKYFFQRLKCAFCNGFIKSDIKASDSFQVQFVDFGSMAITMNLA